MPHIKPDPDSDSEDLENLPFDIDDIENINPYEVLGLERTADQKQIKKAYYNAARKHHPDKVKAEDKDDATKRFQKIQFANTILSDEDRKSRYDRTGSTKEAAELDDDDFNWKDFFDGLDKKVDEDAIKQFQKEYQGSDEEKDDVLAAYTKFKGNMDQVYEHVMLSNVLQDDERFRGIITEAIDKEEVVAYNAYTQESVVRRKTRTRKARDEAKEAEAYAKELKVPAHFFGGRDEMPSTKKARKEEHDKDALKDMIQQRQHKRQQGFFDILEAKYADPKDKKKKTKRSADEPSEEMFQKNAKKKKGNTAA